MDEVVFLDRQLELLLENHQPGLRESTSACVGAARETPEAPAPKIPRVKRRAPARRATKGLDIAFITPL